MPDYPDWRLRHLLLDVAPKAAKLLLDQGTLYSDFFDQVVKTLMRAPLVPALDFPLDSRGLPAGEPTDRHRRCVFLAALSLLRTCARSGFLSFGCMHSESIAVHRRTLESLLDLELLIDRPELSIPFEAHALEVERSKRSANAFNVAKSSVQGQIKDPNPKFPLSKLSQLQRALRARSQVGTLDTGPHAGMLHALSGYASDGTFGFFDPRGWHTVRMTFRYAWETLQLVDALHPKLTWIDRATWGASATSLQTQARVIERLILDADKWTGPLPPWSSFHSLPSCQPPPT
jgi:hypothetical protein